MPHDTTDLKQKVVALQDEIAKLHNAKHADRLLAMIHRPGWTTPQEDELVRAHAASLHAQIRHVHSTFDDLLKAAEKIGT